jgi:hypothetical protein
MSPAPGPDDIPGARTVDAQNPWPGLAAFTEEQQAYFFGRGEEAGEVLRRVKRKTLTVLFGMSGLGKTSLLQAGVFPRLRRDGYLPVYVRLDYRDGAPDLSAQIKTELARALEAADLADPVLPSADETLWEYFHRRDSVLAGRDGQPRSLALAFDQFEELFTLGAASEATRLGRASFLTEISDLVENRPPSALEERLDRQPDLIGAFAFERQDYRVLFSLREDYLPQLEGLRQRMPSIMENRLRLTRMTGHQAMAVVTEPAPDLVPLDVAREIVRFVARAGTGRLGASAPVQDDLGELEVAPPILSLVCRELNNQRLAQGMSQITAPLLTQNADTIIQDFYERSVADQPPEVRAFIEEELLTESGFRENMALEQARRRLAQRGGPVAALDELVRRRLLQMEQRLDVQRIELTHDVLTDAIRRSRDLRRQTEAVQLAEQREAEVRAKLRRSRAVFTLAAAVALVMSALAVFSGTSLQAARRGEQHAKEALGQAAAQAERANIEAVRANAEAERANAETARANAQTMRAEKEAEKAKRQEKIAEDQKKEAERQRDNAKEEKESALSLLARLSDDMYWAFKDNEGVRAPWAAMLDATIAYADQRKLFSVGEPRLRARLVMAVALAADLAQKLDKEDELPSKQRRAVAQAQELEDEKHKDFETQDSVARAFAFMSTSFKDTPRARGALDRGFAIIERATPANTEERARRLQTWSLLYRIKGTLETNDKKPEGARQAYAMAVAKADEGVSLAPGNSILLQQLRRNLFDSHLLLATAFLNQDAPEEALRSYHKARTTSVNVSNESTALWRKLAGGFKQLGDKHKAAQQYADALDAYRWALRAREVLVLDTDRAKLLQSYNVQDAKQEVAIALRDIGYLELALGDKKRALVAFGESRQKANELVLESPSVGLYRRTLAYAYEGLGKSYQANEEPERAEAAYERQREAITEAINLLKDAGFQENLAAVSEALGSLRLEQRRFKEAVAAYTERVAVRRELRRVMQNLVKDRKRNETELRTEETKLAASLGSLAYAELFNGNPEKTVQHSLEAQGLDPEALWLKTNLAHGYLFTKQYARAEELYRGYKDQKAFKRPDSKTFQQAVLDDFVEFRKLNAALPDLDKELRRIEQLLGR